MFLLRFLLIVAVAILASCTMHLPAPEAARYRVEATRPAALETVPVHLLADNLHTALVFDLKWLEESGYVKPSELGSSKYLAMSWGDEVAYVQERWLSPGQVFRALFSPSPSVMECIPIDWKVEEVCLHQRVFVAAVPRSAGPSLAAFLNACAVMKEDGRPLTIGSSSWGDGRLIRCPDDYSYYFPRICNVWTVQALRSCGFPIHTATALSADGLARQATSPKNGFKKIWDPAENR